MASCYNSHFVPQNYISSYEQLSDKGAELTDILKISYDISCHCLANYLDCRVKQILSTIGKNKMIPMKELKCSNSSYINSRYIQHSPFITINHPTIKIQWMNT